MSNQDIEGKVPANEASSAPAPAGTPEHLEQQLEKEREARASMRDRLRHTEALAAESHALRARMAQELERVTADRDRLRSAAANAPAMSATGGTMPPPPAASAEPLMTPRASDWPLRPPTPPARTGPWRALAMLGGLAAGVAAVAWITGSLPGKLGTDVARASAPAGTSTHVASAPGPGFAAAARPTPSAPSLAVATTAAASALQLPGGAVALPPLTPEQQLAAAPAAAGPAPVAAPAAAPSAMAARLRAALAGEGIAAPVEVDAATGHVMVADPQADYALRDRTDLVIRSVYAGASLPEPRIEHRWLSPKRGEQPAQAAVAPPGPAATPTQASNVSPAAAYAARHAAAEHAVDRHKKAAGTTVADAEELRAVLPEGRVTAGCRASLVGKSSPHRADMTACMKHSCCASAANHQAEDCKAYEKSYPFTCSAG